MCAKNFRNRSKFDKVLTKNKFAQFLLDTVYIDVYGLAVSTTTAVNRASDVIYKEI